ncbi:LexA family protein [Streptomyces sp. NPDC059122]|uniref:LexA family protein n=1 Tax=unclassified Streptomyces TaxID=2593676 RepID=UPI00368A1260
MSYRTAPVDRSATRARVARALREMTIETGRAPTVREIGAALGRSASTIAYHLRTLEEQGLVKHDPHCSRSYRPTS